MQNRITPAAAALLVVGCSLLQAPHLNARTVPAGMVYHQELTPAGQDRQEATQPAITPSENDAEAEKEYAAGRAAMRGRDWKRAIQAFKRTVQLNPDYRDARQRLAEARTILNNEEVEAVAARYYDEGVAAMNRNDFDGALDAFEKVSRINRRYRDVAELYAQLENKLLKPGALEPVASPAPDLIFNAPPADTIKTSIAAKADSSAANADSATHSKTAVVVSVDLDSMYRQALAAFERDDWKSAVIAFERIKFVQPNYRGLDGLAAVARANLLRQAGAAPMPAGKKGGKISAPLIAMIIAAVIGLTSLGLFAFSSTGRARFYSWRGNDIAAALLYERMVARQPNRLKLYPALAEIYLRLKRNDSAAKRIFERVLELNLPTRRRAEIHALVSQRDRQESQGLRRASGAADAHNKDGALQKSSRHRTRSQTDEMHKKPPAPRKPRRKKEILADLGQVNGMAANLISANGKLSNVEFETGE